ncbi:MAG: tryptophan--tRNA ligase, partial [Alphaproteobacteria bacterium]|nr:tryptophan--tRNA ligase [Alphaproteobacteria bacterium]
MFTKKCILTGVKPTGKPHIGNYFGAIKPAIEMGHQAGRFNLFIADYHAINFMKDPELLQKEIKEIACIYLAAGLRPETDYFYRQSDIPEINEITTILYAFTPKG